MTEVLGQMLRDGALRKVPTGRGAMTIHPSATG
jgi:hypothetical protein